MISTSITRIFNLETPIVSAGMAMVAGPALAAAVSNAGALGTIAADISPPARLHDLIEQTATLTSRPFGVDLIGDFTTDDHIAVLVQARVAVAVFFWSFPTEAQIQRLKGAGIEIWIQVGRVAEAEAALVAGADALIIQGMEAGGHTRSEASTMTLFPRLRGRFPDTALIASGGIACGRTMAAALALGADAVWCGSRFLASEEALAHSGYKKAVLDADVGDTAITTLYGPEWPDQPMRVIWNKGAREGIGREAAATQELAGRTIGTTDMDGKRHPLPAYSAILPTRDFEGDLEYTCFTAGQSVGNIHTLLPAADIVATMTGEARNTLDGLLLAHIAG